MATLQSKMEKEKAQAALYIEVKMHGVSLFGVKYTNSGSGLLGVKKKDKALVEGIKEFRVIKITNKELLLSAIQSGELDNGRALLLIPSLEE